MLGTFVFQQIPNRLLQVKFAQSKVDIGQLFFQILRIGQSLHLICFPTIKHLLDILAFQLPRLGWFLRSIHLNSLIILLFNLFYKPMCSHSLVSFLSRSVHEQSRRNCTNGISRIWTSPLRWILPNHKDNEPSEIYCQLFSCIEISSASISLSDSARMSLVFGSQRLSECN